MDDAAYDRRTSRHAKPPTNREAAARDAGLHVAHVGVSTGSRPLLQDVSFSAGPGSLTAIIGPSGAGKSTLARLLSGEARPSSGSVTLTGRDLHRDYADVRNRIAMVPQEDVVHPRLTVGEAVGYGAELRLPRSGTQQRRDVIDRVLRELELTDYAGQRVDTLSGGQRKRVSVALELLTEPALLVLDEPTSGLDPALDRQVMMMLRRLADAGRIVVVVTHSLTYLHVCDQALMLAPGGNEVFCGAPDSIGTAMGTADWADIYTMISTDPTGFRPSDDGTAGPVEPPTEYGHTARRGHRRSHRRDAATVAAQFRTVARRQVRLILADRGYLTFLLAMPLILGMLSLAVAGHTGLATPASGTGSPNEASQILSLMCVGTVFMGTALSLRDLFGERAIFRREQAAGLSASAYLLAKTTVLGGAVSIQTAALVSIVLIGKQPPDRGAVVLGDARLELFAVLTVTAVAATTLGLAMSALARSHEQLLPMLVVSIMAQIVFTGGLIPVTGRTLLEQLSWLWPARWGFAAMASTVDLPHLAPLAPAGEQLWSHDPRWWSYSLGMLALQAAVFLLVTRWRLALRCR